MFKPKISRPAGRIASPPFCSAPTITARPFPTICKALEMLQGGFSSAWRWISAVPPKCQVPDHAARDVLSFSSFSPKSTLVTPAVGDGHHHMGWMIKLLKRGFKKMNQELEKLFQSPVGEAGAPQFNFQSFLRTSSPTVSPRGVTDEEPATSLNSNNTFY